MFFIAVVIVYIFFSAVLICWFVSPHLKNEKYVFIVLFILMSAYLISIMLDIPTYINKTNVVEAPVSIMLERRGYSVRYYDEKGQVYGGWGRLDSSFAETYNGSPVKVTFLPTAKIIVMIEAKAIAIPSSNGWVLYPTTDYHVIYDATENIWKDIWIMLLFGGCMAIYAFFRRNKNKRNTKLNGRIAQKVCKSCKSKYDIDYPKCPHCGRKNTLIK